MINRKEIAGCLPGLKPREKSCNTPELENRAQNPEIPPNYSRTPIIFISPSQISFSFKMMEQIRDPGQGLPSPPLCDSFSMRHGMFFGLGDKRKIASAFFLSQTLTKY